MSGEGVFSVRVIDMSKGEVMNLKSVILEPMK